MSSLIAWIKMHKASLIVVAALAAFIFYQNRQNSIYFPMPEYSRSAMQDMAYSESTMGAPAQKYISDTANMIPPEPESAPPTDTQNRLVIRDTQMSMVVSEVPQTITAIEGVAQRYGGYLVQSNLTIPEGATSGNITIRVASDKRLEALNEIRALGIRVISENVNGRDVTDEFIDIAERLKVLDATKAKLEDLLNRGENIQDLLSVQRELINLQSQIDSYKGRQQYLEQSSRLTKITVYLSTDELALPYAPDDAWRPQVVFKQAVRSLITTLRDVADVVIWIGVYAVIWIPVGVITYGIIIYKRKKKIS